MIKISGLFANMSCGLQIDNMKPYPAYKKSGVEWVGEIPEHWGLKRIKYVAFVDRMTLPETTDENYEFEYIDIGNVDLEKGIGGGERISFVNAPSRARRIVSKGDTIVSTVRTYLKAIAYFNDDVNAVVVSTGFAVISPRDNFIPKFLYYVLRSEKFIDRVCALSVGVSYPAINSSELLNIAVWYPKDITEQESITNFLDRKVAKIDDLIAKKERMIELLKEERSAVINQAVTRGLDPNVELKDSGIEWLGKIPKHWSLKRIKHIGAIRYGLGEPPEYASDGLPFVRATDIKQGKINLEFVLKIDPNDVPWSRRPQLSNGEILIVRSGAYTGDSAIVTAEISGSIAGYDMVLTVTKAESRFVAWALLAGYLLKGQIYQARMRAAQPHLNAEELGGSFVLMPPLIEQSAIANFLDHKTAQLDAQVAHEEKSIELLKEFRTALISEVVTGKIDVRNNQ